jgi:hypothetical protein
MAAAVDELQLTDSQAKKIVNLAIEHGAYSDEMPDTKKARVEAAQEAIAFCVDSWQNDGVRPDDDDEDIAAAGEAILAIFEAADIEVDDEGNIQMPGGEAEEDEAEASGEDEDDDSGEAPFDPDDYFEDGYTELTAVSKLKALKELDLEDEETVNLVVAIKEWEEAQDKPASRVLNWIEESIDFEGDEAEDDNEGDEDDAEEPEAEADEGDGEELDEPWDGYDKANAVDIKKFLDEQMDSDDGLTVDQVEYVKEYEEAKERPRKRVLDKCDELIEQLQEGDGEEDDAEEPEEEEPKPAAKKKGALARKPAKQADSEPKANGSIMLTREDILAALADGQVEIGL